MLKNTWYKFHLIVVVMISLLVLVGCSDINSGGSSNSPDENFTGSSFIGEWKSTDSENSLFFLEAGKIKGTCFTDVEDFSCTRYLESMQLFMLQQKEEKIYTL